MKRYLPIFFVLLLTASLTGCSKDDLQDDNTATPAGEPVGVTLRLGILAPEQPAQGAKTQRNATFAQTKWPTTERIIASERTDAMLAELVEIPEEPASRAVDENAIANIWVFQFDGSATTAKLVKKEYFASYTAGVQMNLLAGTDQRVVIIANSFSSTLGDSYTVNTSTYQTLLDASKTITAATGVLTNSGGNLPMSGTATGILEQDKVLDVPIRRDVASISVQVRNGSLQMAGSWKVQLCNVSQSNYYMPHREDDLFPATGSATIAYTEATLPALNTTTFVTAGTWYVPCNCRGIVAGSNFNERWSNIPTGATYLKIWGETSIGSLPYITTYNIPLGADFIDDYNLLPNYQYTYRFTLYDNNTNDSQLEVKLNLEYLGMVGGELVKDASGVWQFTKGLYVEKSDAGTNCKWSNTTGDHSALAGEADYAYDGRTATWNLNRGIGGSLTEFPAANVCYKHAGNPASPTSAADLVWYLPANSQCLAITGSSNLSAVNSISRYWSATQIDMSYANSFSYNMIFSSKKISADRVRCVTEF